MKNDANPDDVNNLNNLRRNENHKYCDDQWSDNTRVVAGWFGSTRAWKPAGALQVVLQTYKAGFGFFSYLGFGADQAYDMAQKQACQVRSLGWLHGDRNCGYSHHRNYRICALGRWGFCVVRHCPLVVRAAATVLVKKERENMKKIAVIILLWATVASGAQAPPPALPLPSPGVFKQNQQNCITVNPVMPQCVGFLVEQMDAAKRSEIEIKTKDVTGAVTKPPCSRYLFEAKGTSYTIRCEP
jgi:hypothetical protein